MRTKLLILTLLTAGLQPALPQQRKVTLAWTDNVNPAGTTYTVKRATGLCSGTPNFSTLATGITVKSYEDTTVTVGNYCYVVTATLNGLESPPSNSAAAPVLPKPPVLDGVNVASLSLAVAQAD